MNDAEKNEYGNKFGWAKQYETGDEPAETEEDMDYNLLAATIDQIREMVMALVQALVNEGFTQREARALVAGAFATRTEVGE